MALLRKPSANRQRGRRGAFGVRKTTRFSTMDNTFISFVATAASDWRYTMMLIDIEPILDAAKLAGKEYVSIDFLKGFEQVDAVLVVRGEWEYEHGAWCCSKCGEN